MHAEYPAHCGDRTQPMHSHGVLGDPLPLGDLRILLVIELPRTRRRWAGGTWGRTSSTRSRHSCQASACSHCSSASSLSQSGGSFERASSRSARRFRFVTPRSPTFYRRRRPKTGQRQPRPAPARALDATERAEVFRVLCSPRFADRAPAEVYVTLLDEGVYLCSERTMYRVLAENQAVRERRAQRSHPMTAKCTAQLLADLGVTQWLGRPRVSNDNPYSEAHFKTVKYHPGFPGRFGCIEEAKDFCRKSSSGKHRAPAERAGRGLRRPARPLRGWPAEGRRTPGGGLDQPQRSVAGALI